MDEVGSRSDEPEGRDTLWRLAVSPSIWALHFLASYVTAAIFCAKEGREASLAPVRLTVALYTAVALAGIAWIGWQGYRRHSFGTAAVPHDFDTRADRHRFLGFATLLLSGMSATATMFVAVVVVFVETCR